MLHEATLDDRRSEIDRRLETALASADGDSLALARATVAECDDRQYGLLSTLAYESMATSPDREAVLPAAAAVELLRGYCRLRSQLLIQVSETMAHSLNRDPTTALLAGDYLYTSAYSTLRATEDGHLGDCFEILTDVSEALIEAFDANYANSAPSTTDHCSFVDETAGALGEGAALVGATLAGIDDARREHLAALGRGFGVGRRIRLALDADGDAAPVVPPKPDEERLRRYARRHLDEADRALEKLASSADVGALRAFVSPSER